MTETVKNRFKFLELACEQQHKYATDSVVFMFINWVLMRAIEQEIQSLDRLEEIQQRKDYSLEKQVRLQAMETVKLQGCRMIINQYPKEQVEFYRRVMQNVTRMPWVW